ncbi:YaiO family outer membrane beta-barrel protein [Vreelandella alkaliphila]|uniref:YaiO family outer membrane beta-barrel protein n=1 Tax=Vreelandella alkaliphila TaxID=272774 RepID=A0A7C9NLE5_9GAMM|nr:YaiO family outer membrane beta-barrel protein [Halomonas alkaliphila]NDL69229.1 YaiO family outer membrane beta-barrel protein [Halomonas alkaliphila]
MTHAYCAIGKGSRALGWLLGLCVLALTAAPLAAASDARTEMEVSQRYEHLDSGFSSWQAQRLDAEHRTAAGLTWYGAALRERRYGEWDEGVEAGAAIPLGQYWVIQPEMGKAFDAGFLPSWYADLRIQRLLADGWLGHASLRRTQYDDSQVDRLALGGERYWGNWRGAYTLNISDVEGAGTPVGHALALDHYYNDLSFVGMRASIGREEEGLPDGKVFTSSVSSFGVRGRHWLDAHWAVAWDLDWLSQGDIYNRYGIQLGIRRAF